MPLQLRRGNTADRATITPAHGEPLWDSEARRMYVGDGQTAGGVPVNVSTVGTTWTNNESILVGDVVVGYVPEPIVPGQTYTATDSENDNPNILLNNIVLPKQANFFINAAAMDSDDNMLATFSNQNGIWRRRANIVEWEQVSTQTMSSIVAGDGAGTFILWNNDGDIVRTTDGGDTFTDLTLPDHWRPNSNRNASYGQISGPFGRNIDGTIYISVRDSDQSASLAVTSDNGDTFNVVVLDGVDSDRTITDIARFDNKFLVCAKTSAANGFVETADTLEGEWTQRLNFRCDYFVQGDSDIVAKSYLVNTAQNAYSVDGISWNITSKGMVPYRDILFAPVTNNHDLIVARSGADAAANNGVTGFIQEAPGSTTLWNGHGYLIVQNHQHFFMITESSPGRPNVAYSPIEFKRVYLEPGDTTTPIGTYRSLGAINPILHQHLLVRTS